MINIEINKDAINSTVSGTPIEIIAELSGGIPVILKQIAESSKMRIEIVTELFDEGFHFAIGR